MKSQVQPILPNLLDRFDLCENNHGGNAESEAVFESLKPDLSRLRLKVFRFIESRTWQGATVDEIEMALGMSHQTASARASELKATGQVVDSTVRRPTRSGRFAAVLCVPDYMNHKGDTL